MLESQSRAPKTQMWPSFQKHFESKIGSCVAEAQGPMTLAKMPKPIPLMTAPTKKPKSKTFQFFQIQTRRPAASFEGLNSSLTQ